MDKPWSKSGAQSCFPPALHMKTTTKDEGANEKQRRTMEMMNPITTWAWASRMNCACACRMIPARTPTASAASSERCWLPRVHACPSVQQNSTKRAVERQRAAAEKPPARMLPDVIPITKPTTAPIIT